jgi:hypothetical protein
VLLLLMTMTTKPSDSSCPVVLARFWIESVGRALSCEKSTGTSERARGFVSTSSFFVLFEDREGKELS